MDNIIYMDFGEKSSDNVVKILEENEDFLKEGYRVEKIVLRAIRCHCGKWYHSLSGACPQCKTPADDSMDKVRVADFSDVQGKWAIEKKLQTNLFSSLANKEIYEQGEKMGAVYGNGGCIVFQGFMSLLIEAHPQLANWISSIQAVAPMRWGIGFTVVEDDMGMAHLIDAYVKQSRHDGNITRFKVDETKRKSRKLGALENAEGVGDALGIKAFKAFPNLKAIANARMEELDPVFHSKARNVYELFNDDAWSEAAEIADEMEKRKEEKKRAKSQG